MIILRTFFPWLYVISGVTIILVDVCDSAGISSDICDWYGSGLLQEEREVQSVYLRCGQGRIQWQYPRGALRLVLRHGFSGRDFFGCLRTDARFSGANIYVEGRRKLHILFTKTDGKHPDLFRCFTSNLGKVALYVEAEQTGNGLHKEVASFSYDLQPASSRSLRSEFQECRPCTEDELLQKFCTSDFVIQGTVDTLRHQNALQRSELEVRITRAYRKNDTSLLVPKSTQLEPDHIVLYRPLKCGTQAATGSFLFLGRWILGIPVIQCAPRITEWQKVRRKAILHGKHQCQLN
ncbi:meteorin-like protein isoform X1 [Tachypleus tridentatus]|uniref:meteorin-like protein isoform X1 n=1 Tax=Tachypleus tridentatus TaxID=6853 RepID=UPI003FD07392